MGVNNSSWISCSKAEKHARSLFCLRPAPRKNARVYCTLLPAHPQVLASQLLLVDEVMKAGKQMGQAPPGGPGGMMEE